MEPLPAAAARSFTSPLLVLKRSTRPRSTAFAGAVTAGEPVGRAAAVLGTGPLARPYALDNSRTEGNESELPGVTLRQVRTARRGTCPVRWRRRRCPVPGRAWHTGPRLPPPFGPPPCGSPPWAAASPTSALSSGVRTPGPVYARVLLLFACPSAVEDPSD